MDLYIKYLYDIHTELGNRLGVDHDHQFIGELDGSHKERKKMLETSQRLVNMWKNMYYDISYDLEHDTKRSYRNVYTHLNSLARQLELDIIALNYDDYIIHKRDSKINLIIE